VTSQSKNNIDFGSEAHRDSHLGNETIWKYQMTQEEANKRILQSPEIFFKKKAKSTLLRLTKPVTSYHHF
jgi:hypothetical protein